MDRSLGKLTILLVLIPVLLIPSILSIQSEQPVITSRISEIIEVIPNISGPNHPNNTLFGIEVEVEILNRDNENQTVIELTDLNSDVFISASFVNQSLHINPLSYGAAIITRYSYQPGIAVEYDLVKFYINQSGLSQLPDGNYTLWRPIFIEISSANITAGEAFPTIIRVNSGMIEIIYHSFYYERTEEVSLEENNRDTEETYFSLVMPMICFFILLCVIIVYRRIKT